MKKTKKTLLMVPLAVALIGSALMMTGSAIAANVAVPFDGQIITGIGDGTTAVYSAPTCNDQLGVQQVASTFDTDIKTAMTEPGMTAAMDLNPAPAASDDESTLTAFNDDVGNTAKTAMTTHTQT